MNCVDFYKMYSGQPITNGPLEKSVIEFGKTKPLLNGGKNP